MFRVDNALHSRKLLTIVFAFISGVSAVSTAVLPGILHF
jgi:hypothetical protein